MLALHLPVPVIDVRHTHVEQLCNGHSILASPTPRPCVYCRLAIQVTTDASSVPHTKLSLLQRAAAGGSN